MQNRDQVTASLSKNRGSQQVMATSSCKGPLPRNLRLCALFFHYDVGRPINLPKNSPQRRPNAAKLHSTKCKGNACNYTIIFISYNMHVLFIPIISITHF